MHDFVSYNQHMVPASEPSILAVCSAALYGRGIFTTVAVNDQKPFLREGHWRRLTGNAKKVGIDISRFSADAAFMALDALIKENKVKDGRARITFFDESATGIWSIERVRNTSLLITTADDRRVAENFRLTVSPYRINTMSPLVGIKSCNYLEHLIAFEEENARGLDEALRLNEHGEITSACMANVFWLKESTLYTPSLKTGCLAGTTREYIIENLKCSEVEATLSELYSADDIFLTSAGIGVVQVAEFDGRLLRKEPHEILELVPKPI